MLKTNSILYALGVFIFALWSLTALDFAQAVWGPSSTSASGEVTTNNYANTPSIDDVMTAHLFGDATDSASPIISTNPSQMELKGVFQSKDPARASALIVYEGKEKIFYPGDALPNGAILTGVHAEWISMERGGLQESLKFRQSPTNVAPGTP